MDHNKSLGILLACAGLAACAGSEVASVTGPTADLLDSTLPFGVTSGVPRNMLSADFVNGVDTNLAQITFNANGSFSIDLPAGGGTVTVDGAAVITDGPAFNTQLDTTSATLDAGDYIIDIHLGEDIAGSDLFILARVEDTITPGNLAYMAFGDETAPASLPTGNGVAYTGGFVSDIVDALDNASQMVGDTTITANFGAGNVDMTFTQTGESTAAIFTGTGLTVSGARYAGTLTNSVAGTAFVGDIDIIGAFYGPGAEGTAGTFHGVDTTGGPGNDIEIIGGFTGIQ